MKTENPRDWGNFNRESQEGFKADWYLKVLSQESRLLGMSAEGLLRLLFFVPSSRELQVNWSVVDNSRALVDRELSVSVLRVFVASVY